MMQIKFTHQNIIAPSNAMVHKLVNVECFVPVVDVDDLQSTKVRSNLQSGRKVIVDIFMYVPGPLFD